MDIQSQLGRIKQQLVIDDVPDAERRVVFRAAVHAFRRWLSPVRSPAGEWLGNVGTMLVKCRLDDDATALAELLAVRAAAQVDSTVAPGAFDDLVRASGLDVVSTSATTICDDGRVSVGVDDADPDAFRIDFRGIPIVVRDAPVAARIATDDAAEAAAAIDRLQQRATGGTRQVEVAYGPAPDSSIELFDSVHDPWRPSTVFSADLKAHPNRIIQPSTLAATAYPPATYRPMLPAEAIKRGFISDVQFECITYCLQATTTYLPGSPMGRYGRRTKGGFIIGDGTGVGKTNEICGAMMDQWLRGIRRHIVVVERTKHVPHFQEAWDMLGGRSREVFFQGATASSDPLPDRDGVLITTYALIRDDRRFAELMEWANARKEFDGLIAFDEADNMRNAVEDVHEEGSGKKNQSQQGMRGVEMQDMLPDGGVIYATATMATDVYNLGCAPRLGLWGENAPFSSREDFIGQMHKLDDGALEQIGIDLKAAGRCCSRTLSFDGVEYEELLHKLTPIQRRTFDGSIRNWRTLNGMMRQAFMKTGGTAVGGVAGIVANTSRMKREIVEQLLSTFNVDTMIEDIHREIAEGNAPVIQIAFTGEARLKRIVGDRSFVPAAEYRDGRVIDWVRNTFPEHRMVYSQKDRRNVPVLDQQGDPIPCPEAVAVKQEALRIAEELAFRHSVLDRILMEFGADNVAEMTGRSVRALPVHKDGKLSGWRVEERNSADAMTDVQAFHDGRKTILVFSLAAGGTGLGYQAAEKSRNKRRRVHYILEIGGRASSAVQGLGRTHRSDQVVAPKVKLVTSDVPAHAIYSAQTLIKIQKLGALSRGHQHATTNAIFEQRLPVSGIYAEQAWRDTIDAVARGEVGDLTIDGLRADLEMDTTGDKSLYNLTDALKHLACISTGDQKALVDSLSRRTEDAIAVAIRNGAYNHGMETIRASSIEVVDESRIDNANGSQTTYYRLRRRDEIELQPFRRVAMMMAAARAKKSAKAVFMRHKVNGRIALGVLREGPSGIVDVYTPAGMTTRHQSSLREEPWRIIEDMADAEKAWNREMENIDTRAESDLHFLSGSLLYNWNRLPKAGVGLNRCQTDDGRVIIGRVIHPRDLRQTLGSMGMKSNYRPAQIAAMLSTVDKGGTIKVDNGWSIAARADGDYRLVVPDSQQSGASRRDLMALGVDVQQGVLGDELVIARAGAIGIIQSIAIGCDLQVEGTTTVRGAQPTQPSAAPLPLAACMP